MDSARVLLLDIRQPSVPVAELSRHHGSVNALAWAPHSPDHMCTAGEDAQALIWDLAGAVAGDTVRVQGALCVRVYTLGTTGCGPNSCL